MLAHCVRAARLGLVLIVTVGCAVTAEGKKTRFVEKGDKYFTEGKYREAVLEYRNVLKLEPSHARAIQQLGLAHFQLGEVAQAYGYLTKAKEQNPENIEVRL